MHEECFPSYWSSDSFSDFFSIAGTRALLAEEAGEPVGMLVTRSQFEQAEILTIAVRPRWRGRGIARQMLARATADMRASGVHKLLLEVEDGNHAALQLYEASGFKHLSRRKLYYRQKDGSFTDALVMAKKLS